MFLLVLESLLLIIHRQKRRKEIEWMQEGVKKLSSDSVYSIYLPINPAAKSNEYIITKLYIDDRTYFNALCETKGFK